MAGVEFLRITIIVSWKAPAGNADVEIFVGKQKENILRVRVWIIKLEQEYRRSEEVKVIKDGSLWQK